MESRADLWMTSDVASVASETISLRLLWRTSHIACDLSRTKSAWSDI